VSRLFPGEALSVTTGEAGWMTVEETLRDAEQKMRGAVSFAQEELSSIRTGRANPKLLDRLTVDYYGTQVPLNQLASFSVPEPRLLVIQPFDRTAMSAMEKAIMSSDLGLTPSNDGNVIRLAFPPLTEERRRDLTKLAKDRGEEGRVAVRNVRRHAKETLERLEREHTISEDELRRSERELQRLTDQFVSEIDDILEHKEKELMEV
jgi:ribosome recycling factor